MPRCLIVTLFVLLCVPVGRAADRRPSGEMAESARVADGSTTDGHSIGVEETGAFVPLADGVTVLADDGAGLSWRREGEVLAIRPGAGLVLIRAARESIDYGGVEVAAGDRRVRLFDGIMAIESGEDGLDVGFLFRGRSLELGTEGLMLDEIVAPVVALTAGGKTLFHRDLRPLIRDDQARIHRVALRALTIVAEGLEKEPQRFTSADLAAMLHALRSFRLRVPPETNLRIHSVLVTAAQREEFEKRHRANEWPALLAVPASVEPWDRVFAW